MRRRSALLEPHAAWTRWAGRIFPSLAMRADWNLRAREDARKYIAGAEGGSDQAFWSSGKADLENLILRGIEVEPSAATLEIGCGLGRLLRPISQRVRRAAGVDVSTEMVMAARRALADRPNVEVFPTTGRLRPFAKASMDLVYSYAVFQHIPSRRAVSRYVSEAARVLKRGGILRFQVDGRPRHDDPRLDTWLGVSFERPRAFARFVEAAGFSIIALWGEHTHYFWVTARRLGKSSLQASTAVRTPIRRWRDAALGDFLGRLGLESTKLDHVRSGETTIRQVAEGFRLEHEHEPAEEFVSRCYRAFLGREPDSSGLNFYVEQIRSGIPPSNVIDCLVSSPELEGLLREDVPEA